MVFFSRWDNSPATLKPEHEIEVNGRKGKVYRINYDIDLTVWEDGTVTAKRDRYKSSDPRTVLPNMRAEEGELIFPIEDLAGLILQRMPAVDLAQGLICDNEVKEAMIYAMANRYAEGFEDRDRRKFLAQIKEAVHSQALDDAVSLLSNIELENRQRYSYHKWRKAEANHYRQMWEWIQGWWKIFPDRTPEEFNSRFLHPDKLDAALENEQDPCYKEVTGPQWTESRDWWRKKLTEMFPVPQKTIEDPDSDIPY